MRFRTLIDRPAPFVRLTGRFFSSACLTVHSPAEIHGSSAKFARAVEEICESAMQHSDRLDVHNCPKAGQARNPTFTNMRAPCAEVPNKDSKRRGSEKRHRYSTPKYRCLFSDPFLTHRKAIHLRVSLRKTLAGLGPRWHKLTDRFRGRTEVHSGRFSKAPSITHCNTPMARIRNRPLGERNGAEMRANSRILHAPQLRQQPPSLTHFSPTTTGLLLVAKVP